jgi:osmotically-inducible protein OsmY
LLVSIQAEKRSLRKEQAVNLIRDGEVLRDVRDALGHLGNPSLAFVGLAVDEGVVRLTGFTESYSQKWMIERVVSRVIGVRDVRDFLEVRPPEQSRRLDSQIAVAAQRALEWDARVPNEVRVEVTDGVLRLIGAVGQFVQREAAEEAVRNLIGVTGLSNEIKLSPPALPADANDVKSALRRRFGIACGDISIIEHDGVVTLSGSVTTLELLGEIERAVICVPGVARVDNRLLVA